MVAVLGMEMGGRSLPDSGRLGQAGHNGKLIYMGFSSGVMGMSREPADGAADSTEAYDRGDKFVRYRACSTLEEYVVVSQREGFGRDLARRAERMDLP
ncbi:MAG TPA: hypothetical protein VG815_07470 [Chloroflexota bacterium]|jgi:hypothetical protein|nr:hypothetical protein [Chloroflexota bacterium]